ncbi:MAG: hypothetical protein EOS71_21980 [Mesorhizobium sp.]|nr:hypothetical protein EOA35_21455 [Mesorhizobium sp. M8A.F.Ca.ET.023.01.1.1]RWC72071.1 MAG: hypothetical protein EOS71_21980 [Mesorhizobium sp.]
MPEILKKIVVKDIGVLRAFATPSSPRFAPLTLIYAGNGRGKTTLTSILKSSATGEVSVIKGRTTLGLANPAPEVNLVFEKGRASFVDGRWSRTTPIEVFDSGFIADNLFAGEAVGLQHDRHLFSIILGSAGVKLAKQQEVANGFAKRCATSLKDAEKALQNDVPSDSTMAEFFALSKNDNIDHQVANTERELKSLQDAERLARLRNVEALPIPATMQDLNELLNRTVTDIETNARAQMSAHFSKFHLGRQGEGWIRFGLEHVEDDNCPFCGKSGVDDLGLITSYSQIFGEAYQTHFDRIKSAVEAVEKASGAELIASLERVIAANSETVRSWSDYLDLSAIGFPDVQSAIEQLSKVYELLKPLMERKRQEPLSIIDERESVAAALTHLAEAQQMLGRYNGSVHQVSELIKKRGDGPRLSEAQLRARLLNLTKRQRRHDPGVQTRIDAFLAETRKDARARNVRSVVQERLKAANKASAEHYHEKVNDYLTKFGATFRISEISNSMTGNAGSVDYGLIVRGHPVSRSRGRENLEEATFANTLSTGDKTTLAFAFFLAGLDRLDDLANRIIVFDDPLSSHDTHRKNKTIGFLADLCGRCAQVIVLSHDAHFLRDASKRWHPSDQAVYEIAFDGPENWSIAKNADLDVLCQSSHAAQLRKLVAFYERREGQPGDVAPAIRTVLETHYRRSFSAYFGPTEELGTIVRSIRDFGQAHVCWADLNDLEACNVATLPEHHGEDPRLVSRGPINEDELHRLVSDCLRLVKAIRDSDEVVLRAVGNTAA